MNRKNKNISLIGRNSSVLMFSLDIKTRMNSTIRKIEREYCIYIAIITSCYLLFTF